MNLPIPSLLRINHSRHVFSEVPYNVPLGLSSSPPHDPDFVAIPLLAALSSLNHFSKCFIPESSVYRILIESTVKFWTPMLFCGEVNGLLAI